MSLFKNKMFNFSFFGVLIIAGILALIVLVDKLTEKEKMVNYDITKTQQIKRSLIAVQIQQGFFRDHKTFYYIVSFGKHQYIEMVSNGYKGGLTHWPDCQYCMEHRVKYENLDNLKSTINIDK